MSGQSDEVAEHRAVASAWRTYGVAVLPEAVALVVGPRVLAATDHVEVFAGWHPLPGRLRAAS